MNLLLIYLCLLTFCYAQNNLEVTGDTEIMTLGDTIGNFSIELMYHAQKSSESIQNLNFSPVMIWSEMSLLAENALGQTLSQIRNAIKSPKKSSTTRSIFQNISTWVQISSKTVQFRKANMLLIDAKKSVRQRFKAVAESFYDIEIIILDLTDRERATDMVNRGISMHTLNSISNFIKKDYLTDGEIFFASALYFKGQWSIPFNRSETSIRNFYDSNGEVIGTVNMMHNRYSYPYANMKELQAQVLEVPYGEDKSVSMLVLLPHRNVRIETVLLNFLKVPLSTVTSRLKLSEDESSDNEMELFMPRFGIENNLILNDLLKKFGIEDVFKTSASLPGLAKESKSSVSKVFQGIKFEVTEEGVISSVAASQEYTDRVGSVRFEVNRPFVYLIIAKATNVIICSGSYKNPYLY